MTPSTVAVQIVLFASLATAVDARKLQKGSKVQSQQHRRAKNGAGPTAKGPKLGKSSKSDILSFLGPIEDSLCPCFSSKLIDETWEKFKKLDPYATCSYCFDTDYAGIEANSDIPGVGDFRFYVKEDIDDRRRLSRGEKGRALGFGEFFGYCGVERGYSPPVGENEDVTSSFQENDFETPYSFEECDYEIKDSDMYKNGCTYDANLCDD